MQAGFIDNTLSVLKKVGILKEVKEEGEIEVIEEIQMEN